MKKLLTLLLTLLMVFMLVGCNSEENTPVVEEPKQEIVEETKEEPEIVGGYVDAEDGTLTDELKDIFSSALEGLMGASYEPVELVATQVVAGTNYKFLANGTKTTNPITKGTYYIYVNKDLQGNVSLLDIETIEEKQEETSQTKKDILKTYNYWVVFYDQYGNELQREALKYGTVPEYKSWLPEGFDKWVYKKSGKDVNTFVPITTNTYFKAICNHVSAPANPEPTPSPEPSVCPDNGKKLYYITGQEFVVTYAMAFEYDSSQSKYLLKNPYYAAPLSPLSNFQVGDFVHYEGSDASLCAGNGDGVVLPNTYDVTIAVGATGGGTINSQTSVTYKLVEGTTYQCSGDGTISIGYGAWPYYNPTTTVTPDQDYVFYAWYDGVSAEGQSVSGTVNSDLTITAKFVPAP